MNILPPLSRMNRVSAAVACALAAIACTAHADAPARSRSVGEVTMSVGPVMKTSANGIPEAVQKGTPILPGDRLDTAEGGHIHVRFVDGAMISVRPGSRLWVEDYRYDPQQVANSAVRFKLEYGVARAISGAAAEGARERFRLNTPLVAIGVRGTDFVVRSGEAGTTALVNQGAILMAPLDDACKAQALGPCGSAAEQLLSAEMGKLFLEFRAQLAQPEFKAVNGGSVMAAGFRGGEHVATAPALPPGGSAPTLGAGEPGTLATTALVEGAVAAVITTSSVGGNSAPPEITPAPAPAPVPPPPPPPPPQLQWGRWADLGTPEADFITSRAAAADGRRVTVASQQFVLFRTQTGIDGVLDPSLGSYSFSLDKSFAQYELAGAVSAAKVESGQLSIDFVKREFATSLAISNTLTGLVGLSASGVVRSDGLFNSTVGGTTVAGAAAQDGKSVGYLFDKTVGAGNLTGITLWSRP